MKKRNIGGIIRLFDIIISFVGLIVFMPLMVLVTLLGYCDTRSPIFTQTRMGRLKKPFVLVKFRTMKIGTKDVSSHEIKAGSVTIMGSFLRKSKLDELPQLYNVLVGDMSLVGPRPNLMNQDDVIKERDKLNIYDIKPGITGLAQIMNIDMSSPVLLSLTDAKMMNSLNVKYYFIIIMSTFKRSSFNDPAQIKKI